LRCLPTVIVGFSSVVAAFVAAPRVVHWPTTIVGYFFYFFVGNFATLGFLSLQSTPAILVTELII
jgi:hypothetical protein